MELINNANANTDPIANSVVKLLLRSEGKSTAVTPFVFYS